MDVKDAIKEMESNRRGGIFLRHIENHLGKDQKVICKICGKDVDTIVKEQEENNRREQYETIKQEYR